MNTLKKVILFGYTVLLIPLLVSCNQEQRKTDLSNQAATALNPEAPVETELLGQLVGTWDAAQSVINRDGSWGEETHSIWKWYYILDGHAIQDDWITIDSLKKKNVTGTNIRIYNPEENEWHMAWIDKTNRRLATFTAVNDNGTVVMDGTNAKGRYIKNTFFNITDNEFDWKQEWTFNEGETWIVVAKIHCTRKK
jgi:hypothetical protein